MPANPRSDAPGRLETVRQLLNAEDVPSGLRDLRGDLLAALESGSTDPVQRWVARLTPSLALHAEPGARLEFVPADGSPAAAVVASVVEAFSTGTWSRLRACEDCRWAFYDHSRSGTRKWCGMYATGPQGRACGSIAKTRRYRARLSG